MQRNRIPSDRKTAREPAIPLPASSAVRVPQVSPYIGGCYVSENLAMEGACQLVEFRIHSLVVQQGRYWRLLRVETSGPIGRQ